MWCTCAVSVFTGSVLWLAAKHFDDTRIVPYWLMSYTTLTFVFCSYAYTRIYLKLAASTLRVSTHLPGRKDLKTRTIIWNFIVEQGHVTSLVLVICYLLFVQVPTTWFSLDVVLSHDTSDTWVLGQVTFKLNCMLDALIYVYTNREVRRMLMVNVRLFACSWFASNDVAPKTDRRFVIAVVHRPETKIPRNVEHIL